jgi:hypothetical protein
MSVTTTNESLPEISVILPVYNGERYLPECIASVLAQTHRSFELLIGDDGSVDESRAIVESFDDIRIRRFFGNANGGLFPNLNRLLVEARAPLVRFLCQDDSLRSSCLKREIEFFGRHPEVEMSYCKAQMMDVDGKDTELWELHDLPDVVSSDLSMQLFFYRGCIPGNLSTVCVRQTSLQRVGLFDESYRVAGDYEMWVRICGGANLGVIHEHLVRLRSHEGQLSNARSSGVEFITECRRIRSKILPMLPAPVKSRSATYTAFRQNVLEIHYSLCCLAQGRFHDFRRAFAAMGAADFMTGMVCWFLTANNHLYKPEPKFSINS